MLNQSLFKRAKSFGKKIIKQSINYFGYDLIRTHTFPADYSKIDQEIIKNVNSFSITGRSRLHCLIQSVRYLNNSKIAGDFVECGVYKGGSVMAMAMTLLNVNDDTRSIYLYDTFAGMTKPTEKDLNIDGTLALEKYKLTRINDESSSWVNASLKEVQSNVFSTGYPKGNLHFIKGKVEDTLPSQAPDSIALLRLDTDWYESTKQEMIHLFPRLVTGGVLIIDDYGHFQGAREAVDEYFSENNVNIFLHRVDYTCRIAVKI